MILEPIIPNLPLVPATIATQVKYGASGLRIVKLAEDQFGAIDNAALQSDGRGSTNPYPLVGGKDLYGRDLIVPLYISDDETMIHFPEAVVNVSRSRNIVATPVLNGRGTVKEMITEGDLDLSISLAVVSSDEDGYFYDTGKCCDAYPYNGVETVRRLLDQPKRLNVFSDFLKLFDLDGGELGIVVKSYSVRQETHTNRQIFEVSALSDYDYNLLIES